MNIEHFSHEHPLILNEEQKVDGGEEFRCCDEKIIGVPSYSCNKCEFYLHQSCAELSAKIEHPLHPEHPLTLTTKSPYSQSLPCCEICTERLNPNFWVYHCSLCNYFAHVNCSKSKTETEEKFLGTLSVTCGYPPSTQKSKTSNMDPFRISCPPLEAINNIKHWSHVHPLILDEEKKNDGGEVNYCDWCKTTLVGPSYSCRSGCNFYLHKSCAEHLPEKKIQHPSHEHPLYPLRREASLTCDACDTIHEGIFYTCPTCIRLSSQFFIHHYCVSNLLPTLKHSGHDHILILAYSIPREYSQYYPGCEICSERLNPTRWFYYCHGCRYFAHVNCATTLSTTKTPMPVEAASKTETFKLIQMPSSKTNIEVEDLTRDVIHLPIPNESVSLVSHFLKEMKLGEKNKEKHIELDHVSHNHPLIFFDVQGEDDKSSSGSKLSLTNNKKSCNVCMQFISNSPFYSCNCADCDFFLHQCCANLPTEVQHQCHPSHPLTLQNSSPSIDLLKCYFCKQPVCQFSFQCSSCPLNLDVICGLLPDVITHESHPQHLLVLEDVSKKYGLCDACDCWFDNEFGFECNTCNFKLHIQCSLLPCTVKHRYDEHPFTLLYSPIENHQDEYLCKICEEEVNPNRWFYHCVECDQSLHHRCVLRHTPSLWYRSLLPRVTSTTSL